MAQDEAHELTRMSGTAEEQEAYRLLGDGKPIQARELAERILADHPGSFAAHHVLGRIFHTQEANLPRALFHLQTSLELFEQQCGRDGDACGDLARRWRAQTLIAGVYLLGDMDRRAEELRWLDRYEESYKPRRWALRAWALMKLDRFDEARGVAWAGIAAGSEEEQDSAWTALCAIASEQGQLDEAYILCRKAALRHQHDPTDGTVEYRNAGHAAYTLFRFDEAEQMIQEATRRPVASYSIPWADLAGLLIVEGRLAEAVQALAEARSYVLARPPAYVHNDQARIDLAAAELLLAAGKPEPALRLVRRAQLHPDRLGGTSAHPEQEGAGSALLLRVSELTMARTLAEQATALPWPQAARRLLAAAGHRFAAWRAGRRVAALLGDAELLQATLRPLHPRGANVPSWLAGELVESLGAGVVLAALPPARQAEERAAARPYLDALQAEALLARGRAQQALRLARAALASLPAAEILLRARVAAVAAQSAWRLGDRASALALLEQVLHSDPGTLRRLGSALPVRFTGDGSDVAAAAIQLLRRSPRLLASSQGFLVEVRAEQICLATPTGTLVGCARPEAASAVAGLQAEPARALALAFQQELFAPSLDLTQSDIRSLEGSPTRGKVGRELKTVIDRLSR